MNAVERTFHGVIVCRSYRRTWAFPAEVAELLQRETEGQSVLHLFGGRAQIGLRLDADRSTTPDVVGNAFYPPFRCESFDAVICDPPYEMTDSNGAWVQCVGVAGCLARKRVWWFSTDQNNSSAMAAGRTLPACERPLRLGGTASRSRQSLAACRRSPSQISLRLMAWTSWA